jgi:RNA polymerase sigma factor (sigma-70 family)
MSSLENSEINKTVDHLFRHEAGKMVSVLTKIFGIENLETAEDVVQNSLLHAMEVWKLKGIPDNPSAWLFRVAKNKTIDIIRRNKHSVQYDFNDNERILLTSEYTLAATINHLWKEELIKDDLLRMMFACCHPEISEENQITIILKTLCGFSTQEIAKAFLTTEETISKRLYRTKEFFRQHKVKLMIPSVEEIQRRTEVVLNAIYLLFNEGYNSSNSEALIRYDLMDESMILCRLLTEYSHTQLPEVFALMALMCFHAARTDSRLTAEGEIILLAVQDRKKWNVSLINEGIRFMNQAAFGSSISPYHLEAAISFEHCRAESFDKTNWEIILHHYEWLCKIAPSPVTELNKIAVILQLRGPLAALKVLEAMEETNKLTSYYLYYSLRGEIYARLGEPEKAKNNFEATIKMTGSETERRMLHHKIAALTKK